MGVFENFTGKAIEPVISAESSDTKTVLAAMDTLSSSTMIADNKGRIIKVSKSTMDMMKTAETDIQKELPHFSSEKLVGSNIDIFHKNPDEQRSMVQAMTSTFETQIVVGGRTFDLVANPVFDDNNARLGIVVEWHDATEKIARELEKAEQDKIRKKLEAENRRVRAALDVVTSNVMVADDNNNIVYANDAVMQLLRIAQPDLRKDLPEFDVDKMLGRKIDIFHKNPDRQRSMLDKLSGKHRAGITVGGRTFGLIASPVLDENGHRAATVVEWQDRTEELALEASLKSSVDSTIISAINGDLSSRINLDNQEGIVAQVCESINELLEILESITGDISESVDALACGNLTRKMIKDYKGSYGTLKDHINSSIDKIVEVVTEIRDSASTVSAGSREIYNGNTNLAQRTEAQAASLEETAAAMEELVTTVQQNTANAHQANGLARGAREVAENGGLAVKDAVNAMEAISSSSNQIADIISVIDEIAFQTNLLALNAAVEAARAGDQGKGFAVVADEVRNLAGRSATAAKEIKDLIKNSTEKVQEGSQLVNKSGETLNEIVDAVKKVNDIVEEISTASEEQTTGLAEVNKAMGEMDEMTQQNAALVEEAASASGALGEEAQSLSQLIGFFDTESQTAFD